jgi:hypothetical protein
MSLSLWGKARAQGDPKSDEDHMKMAVTVFVAASVFSRFVRWACVTEKEVES